MSGGPHWSAPPGQELSTELSTVLKEFNYPHLNSFSRGAKQLQVPLLETLKTQETVQQQTVFRYRPDGGDLPLRSQESRDGGLKGSLGSPAGPLGLSEALMSRCSRLP